MFVPKDKSSTIELMGDIIDERPKEVFYIITGDVRGSQVFFNLAQERGGIGVELNGKWLGKKYWEGINTEGVKHHESREVLFTSYLSGLERTLENFPEFQKARKNLK